MKEMMKICAPRRIARVAFLAALLAAGWSAFAQAPARFMGTITAMNGTTLSVKTDAGDVRQVAVPASVGIKRIAPGQKDLSSAETIQFSDLANGDRVLVRLDPTATGTTPQALQIIAIKQMDVAAQQQKEREDWQRRGVGGLVKSVDPARGIIVLTSGAGAMTKIVTVRASSATVLKRYAPGSVRFETAQAAPITAIRVGDQLRARGNKNADGTEIQADEVVSGSFRNISGTVNSTDAASSTLLVKDLVTKKQVTVHVTADSQMRKLPEMMARMLSASLKGATSLRGTGAGSETAANATGPGAHGGNGHDPQQMLNRAPAIQLGDLKKGDAVMLVTTAGDTDVSAIIVLAGVEPLLEAPAAQNLLSNWSMNAGAPETAQ